MEAILRVGRLIRGRDQVIQGYRVAAGAIKVYNDVVGELIQPRREWMAAPLVAANGLPSLEEYLLAQVLGVCGVAYFVVDVLVNLVNVGVI
jgi:hypothetical protein